MSRKYINLFSLFPEGTTIKQIQDVYNRFKNIMDNDLSFYEFKKLLEKINNEERKKLINEDTKQNL